MLMVMLTLGTVFPCSDKSLSVDGGKALAFDLGSHDQSPGMDLCSPLCNCNCCSSLAVPFDSYVSFLLPVHNPDAEALPILIGATVCHSIWQPPKNV